MLIMDMGCGYPEQRYKSRNKNDIVIGIDNIIERKPDIVCNVQYPFPFKSNTFDMIYTYHVMEHLQDFYKTLYEMHRVAKSNAKIIIIVPHFSNGLNAWGNPEHIRPFTTTTFKYLPDLTKNKFTLEKVKLQYWRVKRTKSIKIIPHIIISFFGNLNQWLCERIWCYWVGGFGDIYVELRVIK